MIRIVRASDSKTRLWIEMKPIYPLTESMWFAHDCANETERNLLEAHLRTSLGDQIRAIRRVSYQRGWRNKSDKKGAKSDLFPCIMDIMEWEKTP
jgi:hypothetical protein